MVPLFKQLENVLQEHGTAGRRRSELVELDCLKDQPSGRRDRVIQDLAKIGHPIHSKTLGSEVVYYYDETPLAKKAGRGAGPRKNEAGKRKEPSDGARGSGVGGKSKKLVKKSLIGGSKKVRTGRSKKKISSDSEEEEDGSVFDLDNDDDEPSSDDDDDDDDDDDSDDDDSDEGDDSSDNSVQVKRSKKGAQRGNSGATAQKRKGGTKKITWLLKEDAALLCAFLKKVLKNAGRFSDTELPFLSTTKPMTYVHMVTKLVTEKDFQDVGLRRSFSASQARVADLLATFDTVGGIASFVLLSLPGAKKDVKQMLRKFISFSVPRSGDSDGENKKNPFTAALRNQYRADGGSLDQDSSASSASLAEYGWFNQRGDTGSSFEECFNARIAPTYKKMVEGRRDGDRGGVCESILQSYGYSVRSGKEVSTAEGLLAAHTVFAGARSQTFDSACFTKVSIKLSKKEDGAFDMDTPGVADSYEKLKVVGSEKESSSKTGHYDKPINRIRATMAFRKGSDDGGKAKRSSSTSSSTSSSLSIAGPKKYGVDDIASCPWLKEDGSVNGSLFDLFTSKLISILASFPGASLELLHSSMAILNRHQIKILLRSMEETKLVRKQIPEESVKLDGLFGKGRKDGPSREATYYIY